MDGFGRKKAIKSGEERVRYFFVKPEEFAQETVLLTGNQAHHLSRVLRLQPGDYLELLDGRGQAAHARIESVGKVVCCRKEEIYWPPGRPSLRVTLWQGLAKGEKMDQIIQKSVELGVSRIIPLTCERSVVRLNKAGEKKERWQKIAMEAAQQCRRPDLPLVEEAQSLPQALEQLKGLLLVLWEEEKQVGFRQLWQMPAPEEVSLLIGPEGGLTPQEVNLAKDRGARVLTLGSRILRTETAGPTALALLMHGWGDLA